MSDLLARVHVTHEEVANLELTPPHPERVETELYRRSHRYLVDVMQKPCLVCGVTQKTLADPAKNLYGAKVLETHHYPIERSLVNACDPNKVHQAYPQVIDEPTLLTFVDSASNLVVLCDVHHRSLRVGIHHLLTQDWVILPFLRDEYQISATPKTEVEAQATDEHIMEESHVATRQPEVPHLPTD